jgi:Cu+-exporting ATPase
MDGARPIDLVIGGMTCAACAVRVRAALSAVTGVAAAHVDPVSGHARVRPSGPLGTADLVAAVLDAGYEATPLPATGPRATEPPPADPGPAILAGLLALPMLGPMALAPLIGHDAMPPGWVQALLTAAILLGPGRAFVVGAARALRHRHASMDLLVALGALVAFAVSLATLIRHGDHGPFYFEAAAAVIAFVRLGKYLEDRTKRGTGAALRALAAAAPERARLVTPTGEVEVPAADLLPGDRILVLAGERVPADGVIADGVAALDESMLTGEPLPVTRGPGAGVIGGALATDGRLAITVTAAGDASRLAAIVRLIEDARATPAPVERLVDRVAGRFVPAVIALAVLVGAGWWVAGAPAERALEVALAVLVVSCPCALGLATPAALVAGLGAAARAGVLFRDAAALERAAAVDFVLLDKTGTLTEGRPRLVDLLPLTGRADESLRQAAALAAAGGHPLARAVVAAADGLAQPAVTQRRFAPGLGVTGVIDGRTLLLGGDRLLAAHGLVAPPADDMPGATLSWLAEMAPNPRVLTRFAFRDVVREGAADAVLGLQALGVAVHLATGDRLEVARAVGDLLGITHLSAGLSPEDKKKLVEDARRAGHRVAMVGDGLNDGPALAAADAGIAVADGSDLAKAAAPVLLMRADPRLIVTALALARRTRGTIVTNLGWAFGYNALAIAAAAAGLLAPAIAGAAMALSSISVVANAAWLARRPPPRLASADPATAPGPMPA